MCFLRRRIGKKEVKAYSFLFLLCPSPLLSLVTLLSKEKRGGEKGFFFCSNCNFHDFRDVELGGNSAAAPSFHEKQHYNLFFNCVFWFDRLKECPICPMGDLSKPFFLFLSSFFPDDVPRPVFRPLTYERAFIPSTFLEGIFFTIWYGPLKDIPLFFSGKKLGTTVCLNFDSVPPSLPG